MPLIYNPKLFSIVLLCIIVFFLILITTILRKRYTALAFWIVAILTVGVEITLAQLFFINASNPTDSRFWNDWKYLGSILLPFLILNFSLVYAGKIKTLQKYWYLIVTLLPPITLLFFIWNTSFTASPTIPSKLIFTIYQACYYTGALGIIIDYYRRTNPQKIFTVILLTIIPILGQIVLYELFPEMISLALGLTAAYVMFKYGLPSLDPEVIAPIVFETMNEATIVTTPTYKIKFTNNAFSRLFAYNKNLLIGQDLQKIFQTTQIYQQVIHELLAPLQQKTTTQIQEAEVITQNGSIIPVSISATKINNDSQNIKGYILIISSIKKIKEYSHQIEETIHELEQKNKSLEILHAELEKEKQTIEQKVRERTKDLHAEHAKLQASINNLQLGFIMTDKEKSILMYNNAVKTLFSLFYPETTLTFEELQEKLRSNINITEKIQEVLTQRKDLRLENIKIENRYITIFISPITTTESNRIDTIGAVLVLQDETEKKLMQRSKEEFFIIASHELRTPLTAIRGYLSLIKQFYADSLTNEDVKKMLGDMETSSNRLINIINDFLDTSRLEQNGIEVKKEPCDLIPLIKTALKETESIAIQKEDELIFQTYPPTAIVLGDKDRVKQIIINLVSNSLKFTQHGKIAIKVEPVEKNQYKVSIADTGPGISLETQKILFHKFQQTADGKPQTKEASTGLGLYISRLLIEKMNGTIQLEKSDLGKGTTFSFTLPMATQPV
jgi:PAS domain S-box-containing protein